MKHPVWIDQNARRFSRAFLILRSRHALYAAGCGAFQPPNAGHVRNDPLRPQPPLPLPELPP
jgi:hypothetical protein